MAFFQCALRPKSARAFALLLAGIVAGVHRHDLLLEELLDRVLDLDLVRARTNAEDILVLLLAQKRRLLGQLNVLNDVVMVRSFLIDSVLSASCASALSVTTILSKASSCSVLTSAAVTSSTGFTLRAAR